MIVLFTDFGLHGPYTGQMKAVLHQMAPGIVVDLFADAPVGNPKPSAYLLAACAVWFAAETVFLCVVDPGVGGMRPAIILKADGRWYVGPGNGLFELVQRRAGKTRKWDVDRNTYRPASTGAISSHPSRLCWLAVRSAPITALNYDAQTNETEPRTGSIEPEKRRDMPQTTGNKRLAQIRKIIERGAEAVVLSKGIWERLNVCPETFEILAKNGIKMEVLQTEAAVERFNELRESMPVGGLFHSTC